MYCSDRRPFTLQKVAFYTQKGGLLQGKRLPLGMCGILTNITLINVNKIKTGGVNFKLLLFVYYLCIPTVLLDCLKIKKISYDLWSSEKFGPGLGMLNM